MDSRAITTVELVHGGATSDWITWVESIDEVVSDAHFTSVSYSENVISWAVRKLMFAPSDPLEGFDGLIGT